MNQSYINIRSKYSYSTPIYKPIDDRHTEIKHPQMAITSIALRIIGTSNGGVSTCISRIRLLKIATS